MAEVALKSGTRILRSGSGELREVPVESALEESNRSGDSFATIDQIHEWNRREKYGTAGATATAALQTGLGAATFGAVGPETQSQRERQQFFGEEHPVLKMAAQGAGAALPALATGGALGAVGAGGAVAGFAEGAVSGLSTEMGESRVTGQPVSGGNIALAGLGGALFAAAIPAVISRGAGRIATGAEDAAATVTGEVGANIGPQLEAESANRAAGATEHIEPGPERDALIDRTASVQREQVANDIADVQATAPAVLERSDITPREIKRLVAPDAPTQTQWATQMAEDLRAAAEPAASEVQAVEPPSGERPAAAPEPPTEPTQPNSPVDLRGKSLKDLHVRLTAEDTLKPETLEALRTGKGGRNDFASEFATTGRVNQKGQLEQGIQIEMGPKGPRLVDGRHRFLIANEQGQGTVYGQVYDGARSPGKAPIYEGPIPIGKAEPPTAAAAGIERTPSGARKVTLRDGDGSPIDLTDWDANDFAAGKGKSRVHANQGQYGGTSKISQFQRGIVDGLKENAEFARSGRISGDSGRLGSEPTFEVLADGSIKVHHGKMRMIAGRELGLPEIYGKVMRGDKIVYEGQIPIGGKAPAAAPPSSGAIDTVMQQAAGETAAQRAPYADALRKASDSLLESRGAADTLLRGRRALAELRAAGAPPELVDRLHKGITDPAMWGRAGDAVADYERSAVASGAGPEDLAQALEDRAAARAKWQGAGAGDRQSKRLLTDAARARSAAGKSADVERVTASTPTPIPATAPPAPSVAAGGGSGALASIAKGIGAAKVLAHAVGHGSGALGVASHLLGGHALLGGAGAAVSAAAAAGRALWEGIGANGQAMVASAARQAARGALYAAPTALTQSPMDRFQGDHPGAREAYESRKGMLLEMMRDPTVLPHAMSESFGDLPQHDPATFGEIAATMQRATTYVAQNMPAGVGVSLQYPRGIPPSQSALRDFSLVWNSAMDPHTVLTDVANGSAVPAQIKALQAVHPDVYQSLLAQVTAEVGQNFGQIPSNRKQWLDILFQSDGLAGPAHSWKAAEFATEHYQSAQQKGPPPSAAMAQQGTASKQQGRASSGALDAIKSGVTNRMGSGV